MEKGSTVQFSSLILSELLQEDTAVLQRLVTDLETKGDLDIKGANISYIYSILDPINIVLVKLIASIEDIFKDDILISQTLDYLNWVIEGNTQFYSFYKTFFSLEDYFLKQIEYLEDHDDIVIENEQLEIMLDSITPLITSMDSLKPIINSVKCLFDSCLEFNDLFNDQMNFLDVEIDRLLDDCLKLQGDRFNFSIQYIPSFTLDQLMNFISNVSTKDDIKAPSFSFAEAALYDRFNSIKKSTDPIAGLLNDVLFIRIKDFNTRNITNLEHLMGLLHGKINNILEKYNFLVDELLDLEYDLIDKRWDIIFTNLNIELQYILEDIKKMLDKLRDVGISENLKSKFIDQLYSKQQTVDRAFDTIYKALELFLLNEQVVSETNILAKKWTTLKKITEELLLSEKTVNQIIDDMKRLSISKSSDLIPTLRSTCNDDQIIAIFNSPKKNVKSISLKTIDTSTVLANVPTQTKKDNSFVSDFETSYKDKIPLDLSKMRTQKLTDNQYKLDKIDKKKVEKETLTHYANIESKMPTIKHRYGLKLADWIAKTSLIASEIVYENMYLVDEIRHPTPINQLLTFFPSNI